MGLNALESYASSLSGGDEEELNQSLRRGFQRNPTSYAQALQRMKSTGVAPDLQEGMEPDLDLEAKVQAVPIHDIIKRHPVLAKYLKDDGFAALAQNDVKPLMGLSTAVQAIPEMKPWTPTKMDHVKDFFRGLMEGTTFSSNEEAQAIRQAESARIRTATQMGINPAEFSTGNASTLPASRIAAGVVRGTVRPLAGFTRYAERKTGIDVGVGSGLQDVVGALNPSNPTLADTSVESFSSTLGLLIPGMGLQKAVGAFGKIPALAKMPSLIQKAGAWGGALAMAIPEAASEAQDVYDQLKAQGVPDEEASRKSDRVFLGNAALLAVTDKIGWFSGSSIARRVVAESLQEGTQTGMSNAATGEPILQDVPSSVAMGATVAAAIPILGKAVGSLIQTSRMKVGDTQEFLKDLAEGVKATQMAQVAPEKVQEIIQEQAKNGQENVFIPAQQYFQTVMDAGIDPVDLASRLNVPNLEEAMLAGTDIVIPTGAYAAQIAPTDLHALLAPDIRLNPGDLTQREMEEVDKTPDAQLLGEVTNEAQNLQTQAEIEALPAPEIEKYRESVKQAFVGGGVAEDTASAMADLWIRPVQTFIESGDITAEQAAQLWPLDVSAYRKGEGKKSITDMVLDRLKEFGQGAKGYFQRGGGRYASDKEARSAKARKAGLKTQSSMDKAMTDVHNAEEAEFAAFDAAVKEVLVGDVLNDKRGFILIGGKRIHIGLLEGRDLSTLLHETSHAFLQMLGDVAEMPNASERTKALWADTLKELGVESRDQIGSDQHEKFASWGERYFMEGKSPSESLKPLMVRFQAWMQIVYKTLEKLGVKINGDVRSVFDRLLATDEEIAAVSNKPELFSSAEDLGASQAEYDVLVQAKAKAIQEGHDRLQVEVMKDLAREQAQAYKDEKAQARDEVEAGVDSRPDMRAMAALQDGTVKLDRKSVEEQFGTAEGIPTVEDGGMEIGYVADLLGYENGASLFNALKNLPDRSGLIDALTEEVMNARYGDVMLDGSIAEKAVDAMHGDLAGDVLAMELRHLVHLKNVTDKVQAVKAREEKASQRAADVQIPLVSTIREQARNLIAGTSLRLMNANKYRLAEEKHAQEAYRLKGKKDYAGAAEAKVKELMNHFLYIEARNNKAFEEKRASDVRRKQRNKEFKAMLGKAGKGFQDAWFQLAEEYEFEKVSGVKLDERRASLLELQKAHEDAGIDIDPAVLTAIPKNYRELTMTELRAIHEAMANIEHVASETQKVLVGKEKMDLESVARELIYAAMTNNKVVPLRRSGETVGKITKAGRELQGFDAYMKQMIRIIDRLDGGDSNGIWHRAIWQVESDAHGREMELGGTINKKIQELMEKSGIFTKSYLDQSIGVRLPGEETDLNHREAIGFLFNLGTAENRNAMRGWIMDPDGFTSPVVDEILSKISKQEADFVQGIWDILESMWPAVEQQEMNLKGIAPGRKTATPVAFKTRDGVDVLLRGGYFPLVAESDEREGKLQSSGDLSQIIESGYTFATTSRSHTKEVTGAAYRVNLDFANSLSKHLTGVIKDLTHREAVLSINRLISRDDISKALRQTIGPETEAEFLPWLKATVNNRNAGPQEGGKFVQFLMKRKHGVAIATLGLNISSTLIQVTDVFKGWTEIPTMNLARAYVAMAQNPGKTVQMIRELSPNRMRNFEKDYHRDLMQFFESKDFLEQQKGKAVELSMAPFQIMASLTAFPAWLGTYQKGMEEHADQERAVREADAVVDRVVQFGDPAHLSRMMREKGAMGLFTMFQGDLNVWYNIVSSSVGGQKRGTKITKSLMAYFLSGILGNLLVGRGPKDDDDWREWAILKALLGIPELVPILGDTMKVGVAKLQGKPVFSQQYSPVFGAILKPFAAAAEAKQEIEEGGNEADTAFGVIDAVGTWSGFPGTSQLLKTSKYLRRVYTGEERPNNAMDVINGVLFNKRNN